MKRSIKSVILTFLIFCLSTVNIVFAMESGPVQTSNWDKIVGTFGSIGFYFNTLVNTLKYWFLILWYVVSVLIFIGLVAIILVWLPLKLYPTFVQYQNLLKRIFGIGGTGQ